MSKKKDEEEKLELLFSATHLGPLMLRNRVVALPLFTGYAHPNGKVSRLMVEHYSRLAGSGAAVVVVANASVSEDGVTARCNLKASGDEFIQGLRRLSDAVKKQGALSCLQLNHGGRFAKSRHPLLPSPVSGVYFAHDISSLKAFMESFPLEKRFGLTRRLMEMALNWQTGMTDEEREKVISDFGEAARRAREADFDMIELHGGTGYLLNEYLSLYTNKIPTGYGGSVQERATFPLRVLDEVKRSVPEGFQVGFRLIVKEWVPEGVEPGEALAFAQMLKDHGVAYVSLTAGTYNSLFKPEVLRMTARPAYLRKEAAALRKALGLPVIISGRVFTPRVAEDVLVKEQADLIGLARPLLSDVEWLRKARTKNRITLCIDCHRCLKRVVLDKGVACVRWPEAEQERIDLETGVLSRFLFRMLVAAAGPRDLELIRSTWRSHVPLGEDVSVRFLFLKGEKEDPSFDRAITEFIGWASSMGAEGGKLNGILESVVRRVREPLDLEVTSQAESNDFGVIMLAKKADELWRERVAYRHTKGVVDLIGSHPRQRRILVPLDLSPISMLLLRFINHAYETSRFDFTFVHVTEEPKKAIGKRWREILRIQGWDERTALKLIPWNLGAAKDLLEEIRSGDYGAVIMGRRGSTGIKRWFLGSVSAGVMRGLTDQSITLVG
jgi:2,4-dienoyl-CoA reductase-like NADH-dependent reductase (Old Yellow Enzyme family)